MFGAGFYINTFNQKETALSLTFCK